MSDTYVDLEAIEAEARDAAAPDGNLAEAVEPLAPGDVDRIVPADVRPPPSPWSYRLSLAFVGLATVLLPLVYLSIVGGVIFLLGWHVQANTWRLAASGEDRMRVKLFVLPLILGGAILFFLLKPFFGPREPPQPATLLDETEEPALAAFVRRIAAAVGAPAPHRIELDNQVNAAASLGPRLRNVLSPEVTVVIGTPLLAGLTVRELGGVLAHEFGHIRQGAGMRLNFLIVTINAWFWRVVKERDRWDERLAKASGWVGVMVMARGCVWLTRQLLAVLMHVSRWLWSLMSRQMEFDADTYEIELSGSEALVTAMRKLTLLSAANGDAYDALRAGWEQEQLPDDFPALILASRAVQQPSAAARYLVESLESETQRLDSHPCHRERIERAVALGREGILLDERPARALLRHAPGLFRELTLDMHRRGLDRQDVEQFVVPVAELVAERRQGAARDAALDRVLCEVASYLRPVSLADLPETPTERDALVEALAAARAAAHAVNDPRGALGRFDDADTKIAQATRLLHVLAAGGDVDEMENVDIDPRTKDAAEATIAQARAAQRGLLRPIETVHDAFRRRVACAGALLRAGSVDVENPGALVGAVETWLAVLAALVPAHAPLETLRFDLYAVGEVLASPQSKEVLPELSRRAEAVIEQVRELGRGLTDPLAAPADFERTLVDDAPRPDRPDGDMIRARGMLDRFYRLHLRGLAELCLVVETVEDALEDGAAGGDADR